MKILKYVLITMMTVTSIQTFAAEITCNGSKKTARFAVKAEANEPIEVAALEGGGSAYIWHSMDALSFKLDIGSSIGSINQRVFTIDPKSQSDNSKKYIFRLTQAWDAQGLALATCTVTVKK
jgi:hypothetical protein